MIGDAGDIYRGELFFALLKDLGNSNRRMVEPYTTYGSHWQFGFENSVLTTF
jgi:hypothetical protein